MGSDVDTKSLDKRTSGAGRLALCGATTRAFTLPPSGAIVFGRDEECELRIDHPSVSRRHARVRSGSPVTVEDLGSRNGTLVRGVRIAPHHPAALQSGDVFECVPPVGGERVNLGRRGPLRRVLLRLTEQRLAAPGTGLTVEQLIAFGWPGEKMNHDAGLARMYTTVQRLRALGLSGVLITQDDGYLLSPAIAVRQAAD
jgi:hypothetical protein